jgi:hypothetical protein
MGPPCSVWHIRRTADARHGCPPPLAASESAAASLALCDRRRASGFFSVLDSGRFPPDALREACTSAGAAKFGRPLGLEETKGLKVDLLGEARVWANPGWGGGGFGHL